MTREELRQWRVDAIAEYGHMMARWGEEGFVGQEQPSVDECIDAIEELDKEYAAAHAASPSAFYDHINGLNADTRVYMATQGNVQAEVAIIEGMMARLATRKAALEGGS